MSNVLVLLKIESTCNYLNVTSFFFLGSNSLFISNSLVWKLKAVTGWVDTIHHTLLTTISTLDCVNDGRLLGEFLFSNCSSLSLMWVIPLKMFCSPMGIAPLPVLGLSSIKHSQSSHTLLFIVFVSSSSWVRSSQS